jgi:hypothetical protein
MTIDWKHGSLRIGRRCDTRKTPTLESDLLHRRSRIEAAFDGKLTWTKDQNLLSVYVSMEKLPFRASARWAEIYLKVGEVFAKFKTHLEPPQKRY